MVRKAAILARGLRIESDLVDSFEAARVAPLFGERSSARRAPSNAPIMSMNSNVGALGSYPPKPSAMGRSSLSTSSPRKYRWHFAFEDSHAELLAHVPAQRASSARNLVDYLALRSTDIRELQDQLSELGLSSLGRSEAHTQATVRAVQSVLRTLVGQDGAPLPLTGPSFAEGRRFLAENTTALLGLAPDGRRARIMVTMPSEAAEDAQLVEDLVGAGMDVMRINCAHDGESQWGKMIDHLARAKKRLGRQCKVFMDVAGPKLRTGPIEMGQGVVHWRPVRDLFGKATAPARVWLHAEGAPAQPTADANLPVPRAWIKALAVETKITFVDLRERHRRLRVVATEPGGVWTEGTQSCYVAEGVELLARVHGAQHGEIGRVQALRPRDQTIPLAQGDTLVLTRTPTPGRAAVRDMTGRVLEPAHISCTLPEIFLSARAKERILFDDGKIGGVIKKVDADSMTVEITQTPKPVTKLGADRGINLPDTELSVRGLTEKDLRDLEFVVRHADGVGMSFVNGAKDVAQLDSALKRLRAKDDFGVIYKIETRAGFESLPEILLAAMRKRPIGVMIARGDLAIECGYERLAELQEEILWVSEAAHVPTIWATQVLETLAKTGIPSRAEITDAAMGQRAECVMLNKGPHIVAALRALGDILQRMQGHQLKSSSRLRMLALAKRA
jgi:pyruvate kinase